MNKADLFSNFKMFVFFWGMLVLLSSSREIHSSTPPPCNELYKLLPRWYHASMKLQQREPMGKFRPIIRDAWADSTIQLQKVLNIYPRTRAASIDLYNCTGNILTDSHVSLDTKGIPFDCSIIRSHQNSIHPLVPIRNYPECNFLGEGVINDVSVFHYAFNRTDGNRHLGLEYWVTTDHITPFRTVTYGNVGKVQVCDFNYVDFKKPSIDKFQLPLDTPKCE